MDAIGNPGRRYVTQQALSLAGIEQAMAYVSRTKVTAFVLDAGRNAKCINLFHNNKTSCLRVLRLSAALMKNMLFTFYITSHGWATASMPYTCMNSKWWQLTDTNTNVFLRQISAFADMVIESNLGVFNFCPRLCAMRLEGR